MPKETQVEKMMRLLKCSEEEARDVIAYDQKVEKAGSKIQLEYDLPPEEAKQAMKYANTGTRKTSEQKTPRKKAENPEKSGVIVGIADFLSENGYESVKIVNETRQISFQIGENHYELTLTAKRKPKN